MDNRELDARIAKEFMGWRISQREHGPVWCDTTGHPIRSVGQFKPSLNPVANALVLDEIERRGWGYKLEHYPEFDREYHYRFGIDGGTSFKTYSWSYTRYIAICQTTMYMVNLMERQAALQAVKDG